MAYNIEFKFQKLNSPRLLLREFCLRGIPRAQMMPQKKKAYDQLRMMIEAWLEDYHCVLGHKESTRQFLSMDSWDIDENPLAVFIKSKSFDESELAVHFGILLALSSHEFMRQSAIFNQIPINIKCIRKVLKQYAELGVLEHRHVKNWEEYRLIESDFDIRQYTDLLSFFSEVDPLGIVGHFLKDRYRRKYSKFPISHFRFRYRYLHHIIDSELLDTLLESIRLHCPVRIRLSHWLGLHELKKKIPANFMLVNDENHQVLDDSKADVWLAADLIPIKIYSCTRTGNRYLMGQYLNSRDFAVIRLDRIEDACLKTVTDADGARCLDGMDASEFALAKSHFCEWSQQLWGVSAKHAPDIIHVELEIVDERPGSPVLKRLEAEKRGGKVERISSNFARFSADVYDGRELFPWFFTFIGYIQHVSFSDPALESLFEQQVKEMEEFY